MLYLSLKKIPASKLLGYLKGHVYFTLTFSKNNKKIIKQLKKWKH